MREHKSKTKLSVIFNSRGQSIVQVVVAAAIMSIVMLATISTLVMQNNESKGLDQKLGRTDLGNLIKNTMADGSVCNYEMKNSSLFTSPSLATLTFDGSQVGGANPPSIDLTSIVASASSTAPAIATVGTPASPTSQSLIVTKISIRDFQNAGVPNSYLANLQVDFDSSKLVRALKPIALPLTLKTTGTGSLQTIVGCATTQRIYADCHVVTAQGPPPNYLTVVSCDPTEYILNGGGVCSNHLDFGLGAANDLGFMHVNGSKDGINWVVDCWDPVRNIDVPSVAFITCCPK